MKKKFKVFKNKSLASTNSNVNLKQQATNATIIPPSITVTCTVKRKSNNINQNTDE